MNYEREYAGKCLTCEYCDPRDVHSSNGMRCEKGWCYYKPDDSCSRYSRAYRSESQLKEYMKNYAKWCSPWYIVTAVCQIMGIDLNNKYISAFEEVVNNFLLKTKTGKKLIANYQFSGQAVANYLTQAYANPERKDAIVDMITTELLPAFDHMVLLVERDEYQEAVKNYISIIEYMYVNYCGYENGKDFYQNTGKPRVRISNQRRGVIN